MNSGQTTITFIAAVNSLIGPLRKQMFAAKSLKGHLCGLVLLIDFGFVCFLFSRFIVKNVVVSYSFQFPRSGVIQKACIGVRFYKKLCLL